MTLNSKDSSRLLKLLLIVLALIVFSRLLPVLRFYILFILFAAVLAFGIYFAYRFFSKRSVNRRRQRTIAGKIEQKIAYCRNQLSKNEKEIADILDNIEGLENKKSEAAAISSINQSETDRLIEGFKAELKLRYSKVNFFQTAINKLQSLLQNHLLAKELLEREEKLKRLREDHYEDLAKLEELKANIEMDTTVFDTIEELSHRLILSNDIHDAEKLQIELNNMTDEMRRG